VTSIDEQLLPGTALFYCVIRGEKTASILRNHATEAPNGCPPMIFQVRIR